MSQYNRNYNQTRQSGGQQRTLKVDIDLVLECSDYIKFINQAKEFGEGLAKNRVKTSQIRKIYSEVQKIHSMDKDNQMRLQMLRPKLAYLKGRHINLSDLHDNFDKIIANIKTTEQLENFKNFFEAILAYHKAAGGTE